MRGAKGVHNIEATTPRTLLTSYILHTALEEGAGCLPEVGHGTRARLVLGGWGGPRIWLLAALFLPLAMSEMRVEELDWLREVELYFFKRTDMDKFSRGLGLWEAKRHDAECGWPTCSDNSSWPPLRLGGVLTLATSDTPDVLPLAGVLKGNPRNGILLAVLKQQRSGKNMLLLFT